MAAPWKGIVRDPPPPWPPPASASSSAARCARDRHGAAAHPRAPRPARLRAHSPCGVRGRGARSPRAGHRGAIAGRCTIVRCATALVGARRYLRRPVARRVAEGSKQHRPRRVSPHRRRRAGGWFRGEASRPVVAIRPPVGTVACQSPGGTARPAATDPCAPRDAATPRGRPAGLNKPARDLLQRASPPGVKRGRPPRGRR